MTISKSDMDRLKSIELEIFKEFKKICEVNNLRYFAVAGTALGAVRHKGFIPWDDDIDVGMPREDYDVFLSIADKLLPEHLFLQHIGSEPNCPFNMAKIRDSRTTFIENSVRHLNMNHGVFIDIFPLDGYKKGRISEFCFKIKNMLLTDSVSKSFCLKEKRNIKGEIFRVFSSVYCNNPAKAVLKREKLYRKHSYEKSDTVINYSGAWGKREIMPKEFFGKGSIGVFEGVEIMLPENADGYLTHMYGDYMTPPPVEKQVPHHDTAAFDLDKSYTQYL